MTEAGSDRYTERSRALLAQAEEELAQGDHVQASEKLWSAAAEMVKAVAQTRGWPHETHRHLFAAVGQLAEELDEPDLRTSFLVASSLHTNFHEGWMQLEYVQGSSGSIEGFVTRLEEFAR